MCPVSMLTRRTETKTQPEAQSQPFPASWPASALYCPALKHDPVSSCRVLLSSRVGEDEEMFPSRSASFSFFVSSLSRGMESEEHVVFSFRWEQCAVTEAEPRWERGVFSISGSTQGPHWSKQVMFDSMDSPEHDALKKNDAAMIPVEMVIFAFHFHFKKITKRGWF